MPLPSLHPHLRFGAHMQTSGGLHNAFYNGRDVGCTVIQVFTKSPQQWKAKELTEDLVEAWKKARAETGIHCLSAHDTYLINPCSANPEILTKSREALADELVRSTLLEIPFVVMHQGSQGEAEHREALDRLVDSVKYAMDHAPDDGAVMLLETMAGQGKCMGSRFEEISEVMERTGAGDRLGVCLDTCHIFAAGYDLRTPEAYAETMDRFDELIGLDKVRVIHANDSKKDLGSRVDRHEAIGQGCIGIEAFQMLLTDPRFAGVPIILETPKEGEMDPVNLAALRRAAGLEASE